MAFIKNMLDKMKPTFSEGGKLSAFGSLFDAAETFFYVPSETAKVRGAQIHDAIDSKRSIFFVVIALIPAILFGMWNIGYQHSLAVGCTEECCLLNQFLYGLAVMLPKIVVSYAVGLGIEVAIAQWKKEEVHEGFFVTGMLIPLIVPVNCPLWIIAIATAFAVIFAKEVFGGTGMNIFNPALVTRAFLFFAYPAMMSGDKVWVNAEYMDCINGTVDGYSQATPLGQLAAGEPVSYSAMDTIIGTIPGSIGETSFIAIMIGAVILIWAGIASWKIILSTFAGGALMAFLLRYDGAQNFEWWEQLTVGGFAFGAVFMATDPVTGCRVEAGKWIYGFLIGVMAIIIRVLNPGFPEGMMLAILLMNVFAPLIDYCFVQANINKRMKRAKVVNLREDAISESENSSLDVDNMSLEDVLKLMFEKAITTTDSALQTNDPMISGVMAFNAIGKTYSYLKEKDKIDQFINLFGISESSYLNALDNVMNQVGKDNISNWDELMHSKQEELPGGIDAFDD